MNDERDIIANEILDFSRNKLLVNLRYMDVALSYHKRIPYHGTIATDSRALYYDSMHVIKQYRKSKERMVRTYLHMILHCVFKHPFVGVMIDDQLWSLACDIAVESVIDDLGIAGIESGLENERKRLFYELKKNIRILTAEKIYAFLKKSDLSEKKLNQWREIVELDDHTPWYTWTLEIPLWSNNSTSEIVGGKGNGSGMESSEKSSSNSAEDFWDNVSKQIQIDLDMFSKRPGCNAGNLMQNLLSVNREKYDYSKFLKKFAVLGETMQVNENEFDYICYIYGLKHYGNMPLIEPLEYKETKRIKEFVIAIDTSGSVAGEEVQMFLQKTYNILMQEDSYFTRVNIHIIQCDAMIQEDIVIRNIDEFNTYLKSMKIKGLGVTDFRPVFNYVDSLIEEKAFNNLKGLIYLTDGYGTFPKHKPQYTAAFVFLKDGYDVPNVPPWAMKLVLQHEELVLDS